MKTRLLCLFVAGMLAPMQATLANEHGFDYQHSQVKGAISLLSGAGGNIAVLRSERGLLLVDNGLSQNSEALKAKLADFEGEPIYVLNTHWHRDHIGSNATLGSSATILAHDNVRIRMEKGVQSASRTIPPAPAHALPAITYEQQTTLHFGDQTVSAVHFPNGHTDGDTVVFFEPEHVVHMGDLLFTDVFPFIDLKSGGSVAGFTKNLAEIIALLDDDSVVISGHGKIKITDLAGVKRAHTMMVETTRAVQDMQAKGLSMQQAQAQGFSEKWQSWGAAFIDEKRWISILWSEVK